MRVTWCQARGLLPLGRRPARPTIDASTATRRRVNPPPPPPPCSLTLSFRSSEALGDSQCSTVPRGPQVRITLHRPTELLLRLRVPNSQRPAGLAIDLFACSERIGSDWRALPKPRQSNDGIYGYPVGGVCIPRAQTPAGSYVAVLSTYDPHDGPFELVVYASEGSASFSRL